jgi:hypothetical protein
MGFASKVQTAKAATGPSVFRLPCKRAFNAPPSDFAVLWAVWIAETCLAESPKGASESLGPASTVLGKLNIKTINEKRISTPFFPLILSTRFSLLLRLSGAFASTPLKPQSNRRSLP